jgi:copper chaperone NosL
VIRKLLFLALSASLACAGGSPGPAALDTKTEVCRSCRMPVSDLRLAAQLVNRGEEPKFFDDIGCLRDFLARSPAPPASVAYVADHRTGQWVRASSAVYTRARLDTPMGSHLIAHATSSSREADPVAAGEAPVPWRDIFERAGLPDRPQP